VLRLIVVYRYGVLAVLCVVLLSASLIAHGIQDRSAAAGSYISEYRQTVANWTGIFGRGTAAAYAQFLEEGNAMPYDKAHVLAHIIGELLYDTEGFNGISYCTDDFNYGCYHGFSSRAVERDGETIIETLLASCGESAIDCEHGMGHGLLAYYGDQNVNKALQRCIPESDPANGGCRNGVMMEYLLNTMRKADARTLMPYDPEAPDSPCQAIDAEYKPNCYFELAALWRVWSVSRGEDRAAQMQAMGHCEQVADASLRDICFKGAGGQISYVFERDDGSIRRECERMPQVGVEACLKGGFAHLQRSGQSANKHEAVQSR
jgi:hypothetical protein